MPSDDLLWAGIVVCGVVVLLSYYVVVWARSVRKQLEKVGDSCGALQSNVASLQSDVGALSRELSTKVGSSDLEAYCSAFTTALARKNKMVMRRG